MKKLGIIVLIILIVGPFLSRKQLSESNINSYFNNPWQFYNKCFFYFENESERLTVSNIKRLISFADSVKILNESEFKNRFNLISENRPLFLSDISIYSFIAICENKKLAITDSIHRRAIYIWYVLGGLELVMK